MALEHFSKCGYLPLVIIRCATFIGCNLLLLFPFPLRPHVAPVMPGLSALLLHFRVGSVRTALRADIKGELAAKYSGPTVNSDPPK